MLKDPFLAAYLVLASAGLKDKIRRQAFRALVKSDKIPSLLRKDMEAVIHDWDEALENGHFA